MGNPNPFVVLGLNPQVLRSLNDEQILGLAKSQYRALQIIYHPDSPSGNEKKSRELNEAYSLLENPETYQLFKDHFLKPTSREGKERELERAIHEASIKTDKALGTFLNYISEASREDSIYKIAPCTIKLIDSVSQSNIRGRTLISYQKGMRNLFYELRVKRNGQISQKKGRKIKELPEKRLVGAISPETIQNYGSIQNVLRLVQEIRTSDNMLVADLNRRSRLIGRKSQDESYASPRIDFQNFKNIAPLITPVVNEGSCLFSINTGNEPFFEVDGRVIEITRR